MRKVFVDSVYWVALLNLQDDLHDRSTALNDALNGCLFVTTEMVLTEVLNYFAERGGAARTTAADFVQRLRRNRDTQIISQSRAQFDEALQLYRDRQDKEWSHTDCVSFRIMKIESISEALTYDQHFQQAGFTALLRS